jgi:fumarate reductase (CoM/CoB) subunit A
MYTFETDVLVIGAGGGRAMAAYEASKHGVHVMMALKGRPHLCGSTIIAPGAIAEVGDWHVAEDSRDIHFRGTIKGGSFLGEQNLVRIMVEESPDLIVELERIGALWQREEEGKTYSLRIDGGHPYRRCPFLEDRTGREMLRILIGEVRKRNVRVLANVMILKLLKKRIPILFRTCDNRLNQSLPLNARRKLFQCILVKVFAKLIWRRAYLSKVNKPLYIIEVTIMFSF